MATNQKTLMFLQNYNNYFNRIIRKRLDDIDAYDNEQSGLDLEYELITAINFNPNDGVNTKHVVQWTATFTPDYMVVFDSNNKTVSQWFVTEWIRTRSGQYTATLLRDVISDNYESVIKAPCFIEKATLSPDDPLIFNDEGIAFNQIKKSETLLRDKSGVGWLVGYIARDETGETGGIDVVARPRLTYDYTDQTYPYRDYLTQGYLDAVVSDISITLPFIYGTNIASTRYFLSSAYNTKFSIGRNATTLEEINAGLPYSTTRPFDDVNNDIITQIIARKPQMRNSFKSTEGKVLDLADFLATNGKTILIGQKYYKIILTGEELQNVNATKLITTAFGTAINNAVNSVTEVTLPSDLSRTYYNISYSWRKYRITLQELEDNITCRISNNRAKCIDSPYDIFCIPYGEIYVYNNNVSFTTQGEVAKAIANEISEKLGSKCYDIQLLPYLPLQYLLDRNGDIALQSTDVVDIDYNYITTTIEGQTKITSIILWSTISNFTLNIECEKFVENVKIESQCDMYRLCSPNYQGIFEFNLAKNGGLNFINVDCSYRPYSPYIHLNPDFGKLYGQDFNDSRGLVCGGDFSIAQVSDAWTQYEINNKNYQNIFDRSVKNMEVNRKLQRVDEVGNAIAGTIQSGVMGGISGGGVAGAIAGTVAGAVGGAADIAMSEIGYKESLSYKTDLYNYNLENIRAVPDSLTKISAFTFNNKIFPFLEYYSCTDEEKEAFTLKLQYNGMTVMRIGKIENYLQRQISFIQGQIIRINDISDDTHMINQIYEEIKKGVFM